MVGTILVARMWYTVSVRENYADKEAEQLFSHKRADIQTILIHSAGDEPVLYTPESVMDPQTFARFTDAVDIAFGDGQKRMRMGEDEQIEAAVCLDRPYKVTASKAGFEALGERGEILTAKYLAQIDESEEGAYIRHFGEYKKESYPHKLKNYRGFVDEELDAFSEKTDGMGTTKNFRSYMAGYIRTFEPELLVAGKPFVLYLNKAGEFCVGDVNAPEEQANLSESESTIYHYLCYLHLSRFWSEIAFMKNQHHRNLPLIVDDFLDCIDESTDAQRLINRALALDRQAFFSSRRAPPG